MFAANTFSTIDVCIVSLRLDEVTARAVHELGIQYWKPVLYHSVSNLAKFVGVSSVVYAKHPSTISCLIFRSSCGVEKPRGGPQMSCRRGMRKYIPMSDNVSV